MQTNHFQASRANPFHISVGALVVNEEGNVCCHYFEKPTLTIQGDHPGFVLLMRETLEPNESLEDGIRRGLLEEFGVTANLRCYLGSIVSHFNFRQSGITVEKTTLYFLCDFVSIDEAKRSHADIETRSAIRWFTPEELLEKMRTQTAKLKTKDVDESAIVERFLEKTKTPPATA